MRQYVFILLFVIFIQTAKGRPSADIFSYNQPKRVSDQRLAEIEALAGLGKMKGPLVVPIGFGKIYGGDRKRRSGTENLQELQRFLKTMLRDSDDLTPQERHEYSKILLSTVRWDVDADNQDYRHENKNRLY